MVWNICITAFFSLLIFKSCEKDNVKLSKSDYIIFGHFHGECLGEECVEIFKLEQGKLFEDTKDLYPRRNEFYDGNFIELSQEKYKKTKDLTNYFPIDLLNETDIVIGQPDAGDWGGIYIEYNSNGVRKFWLIDKMKSNVPSKYHNFIDKVNEKIHHLK